MSRPAPHAALEGLAPLIGVWEMSATFPGAEPTGPAGRCVFEWALDGAYVLQLSEIPNPNAPDSLCVIAPDAERGGYLQHYFDSRGVVRLYAMTFDGGAWTLTRDEPDFSALDFSQRFTGRLSDDGNTIEGEWQIAPDGATFEHDFFLTYTRVA